MPDGTLIKTFLALLALVGGLIVVLLVVKRLVKKSGRLPGGSNLQALSRSQIHPRSFIYIVKAGSRTLLIGATEHSITTLADLTDDYKNAKAQALSKNTQLPAAVQTISPKTTADKNQFSPQPDTSFSAFLRNTFKRNVN